MPRRKWTNDELKNAIKTARSFRQVLKTLGLKQAGGNYLQIQKYVRNLGLDINHFKGRGWNKGLTGIGIPRIPLEKILIINSDYQSFKLKKRLFSSGLKEQKCELCGWSEKATDGRLPLELDHINGNHRDNRLENLRILCPNCHSLQPNYRGRNIGKII